MPEQTIWGDQMPPAAVDADSAAVELGTKFTPLQSGEALGVRFYKTAENEGPHVGTLWTAGGRKLAAVNFANETSNGWQVARFATPVKLTKNVAYVVSYHASKGRYVSTQNYLGSGTSTLAVRAGASGFYAYGPQGSFPRDTWKSSQYWVDVQFRASGTVTSSPSTETPAPSSAPTPPTTASPTSPPTTASPTPSPTTVTPSPTTSTTADPTKTVNCAARPSACGFPDALTTGPTDGQPLTDVPGGRISGPGWTWQSSYGAIRVTGAGAVLDHLNVSGGVIIDAPDVTLSNSVVTVCGGGGWDSTDVVAVRYRPTSGYEGANASILKNRLNGLPEGCSARARSGVRDTYGEAPGLVVDGNNISGVGNGVTAEYEATIRNNWVHDLGHLPDDHHSGISTHGGAKQINIINNTVLLNGMPGLSAALTIYSDFGHAQNVTLDGNIISGGAYSFFGGNSGGSYTTPATNIRFVNNRFVCGAWVYGPVAFFTESSAGNYWNNNRCDQDLSAVAP